MAPHANDEGESELGAIGIIEPMEGGEFLFRQAVEVGACLFSLQFRGQRAGAGRFAGEIGVPLD